MHRDYVGLLLRIGVAFALIYPAVSGFFTPLSWIGFFPPFVSDAIGNEETLIYALHLFGIFEIALALWILAGRKVFVPSAIATFLLFVIVVGNITLLDTLFRDIPIMLSAMALALMSRQQTATPV